MSETWTEDDTPAEHRLSSTEPAAGPTGHPVVDEVLASVDGLEHRPVGEHVAVFEAAHGRLRESLAGANHATPDA